MAAANHHHHIARPTAGGPRPPRPAAGGPSNTWPANAALVASAAAVRTPRGKQIDTHELLKREAFRSPNDASDSHFEKSRPSPDTVYGVSDQYMVLDSFEQVQTSRPDQGRFTWNFMVQGVTGNQVIGVKDKIDTVIAAQIASFTMPQLAPAPYTLNPAGAIAGVGANSALPILTANGAAPAAGALTSPLTQLPYGGRVTIEMAQMGHQSISDSKGARHHFEFQATNHLIQTAAGPVDSGMLLLTPLHDWNVYVFTDPIQDVLGLTLVFRNPDSALQLPNSCIYGATASVDAAAQVLTIGTAAPHGLAANDRVFFRDFASGNPVIDNYVNNPAGVIVGAGGLTATAFRLNPDVGTALLGLGLGAAIPLAKSAVVGVAKYRIRVPLRLRRIVDRLTNYIAP